VSLPPHQRSPSDEAKRRPLLAWCACACLRIGSNLSGKNDSREEFLINDDVSLGLIWGLGSACAGLDLDLLVKRRCEGPITCTDRHRHRRDDKSTGNARKSYANGKKQRCARDSLGNVLICQLNGNSKSENENALNSLSCKIEGCLIVLYKVSCCALAHYFVESVRSVPKKAKEYSIQPACSAPLPTQTYPVHVSIQLPAKPFMLGNTSRSLFVLLCNTIYKLRAHATARE
jgi:hypothetical protein